MGKEICGKRAKTTMKKQEQHVVQDRRKESKIEESKCKKKLLVFRNGTGDRYRKT